ncbi:hypothetical protein WR25_14560 [Diploscapter pachys]|uniref:Uncharacterized protein n=1 Tax=Diploscapter pachys TaxID=2018661 RepID=A0A2A2L4Y7_9BILA|nr:hypothetical protein WR25_14560 [Diploscapter pachys]
MAKDNNLSQNSPIIVISEDDWIKTSIFSDSLQEKLKNRSGTEKSNGNLKKVTQVVRKLSPFRSPSSENKSSDQIEKDIVKEIQEKSKKKNNILHNTKQKVDRMTKVAKRHKDEQQLIESDDEY